MLGSVSDISSVQVTFVTKSFVIIKPFYANDPFIYSLKTSKSKVLNVLG